MNTVSVIIPIYNGEKTLVRCLESLKNQTYRNLEIIMVNDGSKDDSEKICRTFEQDDERFILINQANAGVAHARNAGLKRAAGSFILFVDADDYIEHKCIEYLVQTQSKYNADIVEGGYFLHNHKGEIKRVSSSSEQEILGKENIINHFLLKRSINATWGKLYRSTIAKSTQYRQFGAEDFTYNCEVYNKSTSLVVLNIELYHYFEYENSLSHQKINNFQLTEYENYTYLLNTFNEKNYVNVNYFDYLICRNCMVILSKLKYVNDSKKRMELRKKFNALFKEHYDEAIRFGYSKSFLHGSQVRLYKYLPKLHDALLVFLMAILKK